MEAGRGGKPEGEKNPFRSSNLKAALTDPSTAASYKISKTKAAENIDPAPG